QCRLRRESLEEVYDFGCEGSRLPSLDDQGAQDLLLDKQRHRKDRSIAEPRENAPNPSERIFSFIQGIRDLDWRPQGCRPPRSALPAAEWFHSQSLSQLVFNLVGSAKMKFLGRVIVLVNEPATGLRELDRAGDNRVQDGLQIQRRAHRSAYLTERLQLPYRPRQLGCPRLEFAEQS